MSSLTPGSDRHVDAAATPSWYLACLVMFAALPVGITLLWLHDWTAAYWAFGVMGALECFFVGWFVGRSSRV